MTLYQIITYSHLDHQGSSDNSEDDTKRHPSDRTSPDVKAETDKYGPAAYGPFSPSPSWGPSGGANSGPAQFNGSQFPPGQNKLPPISNAFPEKGSPYVNGRYANGVPNYAAYEYYMNFASSGNFPDSLPAPADLSTNRKRPDDQQHHQRGGGAGSAGSRGRGKDEDHVMPLCLDDVAAMTSSFTPRGQGDFRGQQGGGGGVSGPVQMGSLAAEAAHTAGGMGGPEQEDLKRENDALKQAVRRLAAQVDIMKGEAYKD